MPIIFNIDKAIASSEFNVLGLSIPILMEREQEAFEKTSKISALYTFRTLDQYSTSIHSTVDHGGFQPTEDMEPAPLHDWEDSYGKTFTAQTWMDGFAISKQAIEDNQNLDINQKVSKFSTAYGRTREMYAAKTASGALQPGFTFNGRKFSALAIDTMDAEIEGQHQKYFNKYHFTSVKVADATAFAVKNGMSPWTVPSGTDTGLTVGTMYSTAPQSNKFIAIGGGDTAYDAAGINLFKINPALGNTAANTPVYEQLRTLLMKLKEIGSKHRDLDGHIVPLNYTRILMPSNALLGSALRAAVGGNLVTGPFDGPLPADKFEIVEWPYLNGLDGFGDKEFGFLVIDPTRNSQELGFSFWDRIKLTVSSYIQDNNENMIWKGRARFKADTSDPYSVMYCALGALKDLSAAAYSGNTKTYATDTGTKDTAAHTIPVKDSNATFINLTDFTITNTPTVYDPTIVAG